MSTLERVSEIIYTTRKCAMVGSVLVLKTKEHFAVEIPLNYCEAATCNILYKCHQKYQHANQYVKNM